MVLGRHLLSLQSDSSFQETRLEYYKKNRSGRMIALCVCQGVPNKATSYDFLNSTRPKSGICQDGRIRMANLGEDQNGLQFQQKLLREDDVF